MDTEIQPTAQSRADFAQAQQTALDTVRKAREEYAALPEDAPGRELARARMLDAEDEAETLQAAEPFAAVSSLPISSYESGILWVDMVLAKWKSNPGLMLYKLQANAYKFSWILIPLSLPFVWLLFAWKRRFNAYDHAIFVTYSLSFMTLLFIVTSVLGRLGVAEGWLLTIVSVTVPLHIYKQMRGAYQLSRFSTLWRLAILFVFIVAILLIFIQLLLALGTF